MDVRPGIRGRRALGIALVCALAWVMIGTAAQARTKAGAFDRSFGRGGLAVHDLPGRDLALRAAVQPDGKIVLAGVAGNRVAVMRLLPDGRRDRAFGRGGTTILSHAPYAWPAGVELAPDGSIIVGTSAYSPGSYSNDELLNGAALFAAHGVKIAIVKLTARGTVDRTFGDQGVATPPMSLAGAPDDVTVDIAVQRDGAVLVFGVAGKSLGYYGYPSAEVLMRFTPHGQLDPGFGVGGVVLGRYAGLFPGAASLAIQPDGRIVVGSTLVEVSFGEFLPISMLIAAGFGSPADSTVTGDVLVSRYLANGVLDPTFGGGGSALMHLSLGSDSLYGIALQPDGKIIAYGLGLGPSLGWESAMARLNPDGSPDSAFGNDGRVIHAFGRASVIKHVVVEATGGILAAVERWDERRANMVVRFTRSGELDPSFGSGGGSRVPLFVMTRLALQYSRVLAVGAAFPGPERFAVSGLAR